LSGELPSATGSMEMTPFTLSAEAVVFHISRG
jgi:hypothetical protein